jgi:hypothetical protein
VAAAFREVAASEEAQAMGHLEFLQEFGDPVSNQPMGSTKDNLNCAIVSLFATLNCATMTAFTLIAPCSESYFSPTRSKICSIFLTGALS